MDKNKTCNSEDSLSSKVEYRLVLQKRRTWYDGNHNEIGHETNNLQEVRTSFDYEPSFQKEIYRQLLRNMEYMVGKPKVTE